MRDRFIHRGWSVRRCTRNDNPSTWAVYEKGQRSGPPRGYVWRSSDATAFLCDGGRSAIADARSTPEEALDLTIDRIEAHRPQFGGSRGC